MNNLLSYCGVVEIQISASEKDLPVLYPLQLKYFKVKFVAVSCLVTFLRGKESAMKLQLEILSLQPYFGYQLPSSPPPRTMG